jgi:glycosyltransferase involved in cell wall biosynthesis
MNVSIIIRTLNEAEHLPALLGAIAEQDYPHAAISILIGVLTA